MKTKIISYNIKIADPKPYLQNKLSLKHYFGLDEQECCLRIPTFQGFIILIFFEENKFLGQESAKI